MSSLLKMKPIGACLTQSQDAEIIIEKQTALQAISDETHTILSQLSPEVLDSLTAPYAPPSETSSAMLINNIAEREFAIENASAQIRLDQK